MINVASLSIYNLSHNLCDICNINCAHMGIQPICWDFDDLMCCARKRQIPDMHTCVEALYYAERHGYGCSLHSSHP